LQALIKQLHRSPLGQILDFKCRSACNARSSAEYNRRLSISFTRQGSFRYHVGRRSYDIHSGVMLMERAGCEYTVSHRCAVKDECTIYEFEDEYVEELKESWVSSVGRSILSTVSPLAVLPTTPGLEFLHAAIRDITQRPLWRAPLKTDALVIALLQEIAQAFGDHRKRQPLSFRYEKLKDHQIEGLDRAKHFIVANFRQELSLAEIARHSYVSVFHFSRLFKQFTALSPHRFLIDVRLKHAALLLRHTSLPITQICFDSGFNSFEHFILTFNKHYGRSPSKYRRQR